MLDGKFSVYNGSSGGQAPPPEVKKEAPVNFKYESIQATALSFDDELRLAMQKFHKSKEPSPTKVALKKWVSESYSMIFPVSKEVPQKKAEPKPLKNPIDPYLKVINEKKESAKTYIKTLIPDAPKEVKPFENPLKPVIQSLKNQLTERFEKIVRFIPDVHLPQIKMDIKSPNIQFTQKIQVILQPLEQKIERVAETIKERVIDRVKERYERTVEKLEDLVEDIYEKIPSEKIAEVVAFIQDIPQVYIIPMALWFYSFVPTAQIRHAFESGIRRITAVANHLGRFAQKGYKFIEKQATKVARFLMKNFILPLSSWLESFLRFLAKWIFEKVKIAAVFTFKVIRKLPGYTVKAIKTIGRLTLWIASKAA